MRIIFLVLLIAVSVVGCISPPNDVTIVPAATAPFIRPTAEPNKLITVSATTPDGSFWYAFDPFDDIGGAPPAAPLQGLFRRQGEQITHLDVPATIRALAVAPDGSLYMSAGCGIQRFQQSVWETLIEIDCNKAPVVEKLFALTIEFGPGSEVWAGGALQLARFDGQRWRAYNISAVRMALASDGAVWAKGWDGYPDSNCCITRVMGDQVTTYPWDANLPLEPHVRQVFSTTAHRPQ